MQSLVENDLAMYNSCDVSKQARIMDLLSATSSREKSERSKLIIDFAETLEAKWKGQPKLLYVAPSSLINFIDSKYKNDQIHLLEFSNISKNAQNISPMYSKFVGFMH
jgi:hypothetical protein